MEEDYFVEEEEIEEEEEEEKQNRTFIILVAALGGLLALGICAFVVWAVVGSGWMQDRVQGQNVSIQSTNEAVAMALDETATVEAQPTATRTLAPTDTPIPTPTPTPVPPSATPSRAPATVRPTITRRPTATATAETTSAHPPDTGIGALGASALAVGLLFVLIVVRRLRKTV